MAKPHDVHTLQGNLEAERLNAVEALAATDGVPTSDAVRECRAAFNRETRDSIFSMAFACR